ncbi:hypothetical protein M9H77_12373 [Catharanthus roseus]|uniref:Uncharacterized protein n=1 Tax=Catharanthus roseus TaxID=4058 RepID=A0ACC0BHD8_CATRO|nr:hypothetical protein M9H77_12373 [Catharanthus roseus]
MRTFREESPEYEETREEEFSVKRIFSIKKVEPTQIRARFKNILDLKIGSKFGSTLTNASIFDNYHSPPEHKVATIESMFQECKARASNVVYKPRARSDERSQVMESLKSMWMP